MPDEYPGVEKMGLLGPVIKNSLKALHARELAKSALTMMGGNTRVSRSSLKGKAIVGRVDNLAAKAAFRSGPVCGGCDAS